MKDMLMDKMQERREITRKITCQYENKVIRPCISKHAQNKQKQAVWQTIKPSDG